MIKKISVVIAMTLLVSSTAWGMPEFLERANIIKQIKAEIAKTKISTDVTIFDETVINGIGQGIKYRYESEPSYVDQYYTRIDQYTLNVNANIGTLLGVDTTPFGFSIAKGSDITFARQFKSQIDSVLALPYTPLNIPFTVEKMNKLKNGDFVGFTTTLNMVVNISAVLPVGSIVNVSLGAYALVQGQFMIHFFKVSDNYFRIKIISVETQTRGINAGIGLITNQVLYKVKQIVLVGNKIAKFVDITPLVVNASKGKSNLVMFDYVFNAKDPRAVEAYNNFSLAKVAFKDTSLVNPLKSFEKTENVIMTDLTEVDSIVLEDTNKPATERAITRVFWGDNNSKTSSRNFNIKFNIVNYGKGHSYTQSKIKSTDRQNNPSFYLFDSFSMNSNFGLLFDVFGVEDKMYSNILHKANKKFEPEQFSNLIFSREIKIKQFTANQYSKLKAHAKQVLPEAIYKKIGWKEIDFTKKKIVNGFFKNQVFFTNASLAAAPCLSQNETYEIIKPILREQSRPRIAPSDAPEDSTPTSLNVDWTLDYEKEIQQLALIISNFLNKEHTPVERYTALLSLKDSEMWRNIAVKFLMTILPEDALENTVRYDLVLEAKGIEAMRFKSGSAIEGDMHKNLMYIQSIINNRSFDLRLLTNDDGEFLIK